MLIRASTSVRRVALPVLAALMLLMQALGLLHAVMHGAGHRAGDGTAQATHQPVASAHAEGHELFGDHDDDAGCRLYDQLAHADAACGTPVLGLCEAAQARADVALPSVSLGNV